MKILLVDDESLLLDSLETMIDWAGYGITLVGKALSGEHALKICSEQCPDLIITDIKMGQMSGLELIKKLQEQFPTIKVIVMSAYNDFSYAQEAIELKVSSYLLKLNAGKEELLRAIMRVKDELENKDQENLDFMRSSILAKRNGQILNYMRGKISAEQLDSSIIERIHNMNSQQYIMITFQLDAESESMLLENIELRFELNSLNPYGLTAISEHRGYLFYSPESCSLLSIKRTVIRIKSQLSAAFGMISVGVSAVADLSRITETFIQANSALNQSFFQGKNSIIIWNEEISDQDVKKKIPAPYQLFIPYISSGNYIQLEKKLLDLIDNIEAVKTIGQIPLINMVEYIMLTLYQRLPSNQQSSKILDVIETLKNVRYLSDLRHMTQWLLHQISDNDKYADVSPIIKQCIKYILSHYKHPLSLTEISEMIQTNPTYLSKLFHQETGENITNFIRRCKMEYAKDILQCHQELEIHEVATELGFDSASYFTLLFRKYTGKSPSEFRKNMK